MWLYQVVMQDTHLCDIVSQAFQPHFLYRVTIVPMYVNYL